MRVLIALAALLFSSPVAAQDSDSKAGRSAAEREFAYNAYRTCLQEQSLIYAQQLPAEPAISLVFAAENSCTAESGRFHLAVGMWAHWHNEDGPASVREDWKRSAFAEAVAAVLEYRSSQTG